MKVAICGGIIAFAAFGAAQEPIESPQATIQTRETIQTEIVTTAVGTTDPNADPITLEAVSYVTRTIIRTVSVVTTTTPVLVISSPVPSTSAQPTLSLSASGPTTGATSEQESTSKSPSAATIGGIAGPVVAVLIAILLVLFIRRRRKGNTMPHDEFYVDSDMAVEPFGPQTVPVTLHTRLTEAGGGTLAVPAGRPKNEISPSSSTSAADLISIHSGDASTASAVYAPSSVWQTSEKPEPTLKPDSALEVVADPVPEPAPVHEQDVGRASLQGTRPVPESLPPMYNPAWKEE